MKKTFSQLGNDYGYISLRIVNPKTKSTDSPNQYRDQKLKELG
jgi:hypothetical protein